MPSATPDDLPQVELAPGYRTRCAEWGEVTVVFERMPAGQDVSSMLDQLPDGRCQSPHWGYLLKGRVSVDYGDRQETIESGQAYYLEPGHTLTILDDAEALEFSKTADLAVTLDAVRRSVEARGA
jgi:hypothetical protein